MSIGLDAFAFDPGPWRRLLEQAAHRYEVPGMVAGVVHINPATGREQRMVAATGVTSLETGVPVDRDTVFQIGSVTKVVTATMIMQLRDEGKLALDAPVADLLEGFALASDHAEKVTVRHLLTHTSGIDGDLFTDTGRGDDCVQRYVAALEDADSLFVPGEGWSYCNSGFVVLGRIVEVLDERSWDASLQARVADPLGLTRFVTLPEEVLRFRAAYGHLRPVDAPAWAAAPSAMLARSMGPAGNITSSADDLLSFAAAVLRNGATLAGERLVSSSTLAEMGDKHWELDPAARRMAPEWALGWMRDRWDGHLILAHAGRTIGHNAWLQVMPDDGLAFVVFCNGGTSGPAAYDMYSAFADRFAGVTAPQPMAPNGPASQAHCDSRWLGTYADASTAVSVRRDHEGLAATVHSTMDRLQPEGRDVPLYPADSNGAAFLYPGGFETTWAKIAFSEIVGQPVMYHGNRALPRRSDDEADGSTSL